ncbi:reticulon-3-like isoform X2 [Patagioenas fasciata]|uniref:reticulon-3-like isoform X2 n=1 Tax=Patagioenas fasciata TaxID=372321 RepID=UPI003A990DAA
MATTSACAAPPGCGGRERGAQAWPRPHPPSPAHRKPRPPAAGAAARTEPQTPGQTDGRALGGSAISPVSAMAEPAAQAPLLSSAAASGPCGGSGPAFCADPPKSSSSSSSVSLSVAAPAVRDVLLWRPPGRSGALLALSALLLLSLSACSAVAVLAHAALALLSVTISLRVYRGLLAALQRAPDAHPFRAYLDLDLTLTPERFEAVAVGAARQLDRGLRRLLRLLLVHDLLDSLKLAVTMWLLTYVGAVFNGITLLILAELLAFTLPPLYEKYKVQIDHSMGVARQQIDDVVAKVHAKLPFLAKKPPQ